MDAITLTYPIMKEIPFNVRLSSFEFQIIANEVLTELQKGYEEHEVVEAIERSLPHNVRLSKAELSRMAVACMETWERAFGPNFIVKVFNFDGVYGGCGYFETLAEAIEYKLRQESSERVAKVYRLVEFEEVK